MPKRVIEGESMFWRWPGECIQPWATEDASVFYDKWKADRAFLFVPAQAYVAQMLQTLIEFPQRQKSASFSLEQVMAKLEAATTAGSS